MDNFLLDIYRLSIVTGSGRPDAYLSLPGVNKHLSACAGTYLVAGELDTAEGKVMVTATVMCGHGEAEPVEFALNENLWILGRQEP